MNILVAGFPYIRQNYFNVFKYYPLSEENLFFLLPKSWKVKGGKVIFYPPKEKGVIPATAFFHHSNYPIIGGALKGWMPIFPLVALKLKFKKLDMVYSCSEPSLLTTLYQGFWTKLFGLRHIVFSWENIPPWQKFRGINWLIKKLILKINLFLADGIICGNQKGAVIYSKLTDKPIVVIPMAGVDTELFKKQSGVKTFQDKRFDGKIVFTYAGAIGERKGLDLILRALFEIKNNLPNVHLVIAGSGEYEGKLGRLMAELNLRESVSVFPWLDREELAKLFSVSDVFLYPSIPYGGWEEQFGYSMAEASLMELPVISTQSGSIEEVVVNGKTGILVEPSNIKALRDAMLKLAENPELRKKMGQAGRQHIIENFSHQKIAPKLYEFFRAIV